MAITISGNNNNDKILASDGVIDQISGINIVGLLTASHINVGSNIQLGNAGIITATTFVGNVTGNVNSTSPLLLQTGGSERFRITGNNELGIAGANYGSAGQVLTSGGSGSAVTWSTIPQTTINGNVNNRVITGSNTANTLNGNANLTYDGNVLALAGNDNQELKIGAGADLILKADGSNSAIVHNGDGDLAILAQGSNENIKIQSTGYLHFNTAGNNERLRIDSTGKLGLGITPDTWHTNNQKVFQISGTNAGLNIFTRAGTAHLSSNFIYNSSDAGVFQAASGYAMHHAVSATNGTFDWLSSSAASSSAGSSATMINRLRINSSGFIGMGGNTNPTNVLHIKTAVNNTAVATIESTATNSYPFLRLKNDAREYQLTCHGILADAFTIYDGTAGAHRFLIEATGNTDVKRGLRVSGEDAGWGSGSEGAFMDYYASGSMVRIGHVNGASGSAKNIVFYSGGTSRLTIQSTGIVKAETSDSSSFNAHFLVNNSESNSGVSLIGSGSSFSAGGWAAVTDAGIIRSSANSSNGLVLQAASGDMRFYVAGNPPAERLRITSGGDTELRNSVSGINNAYSQYLKFRTTQSNGQSAITGAIRAQGKSGWGGDLVFYSKPANGSPNDSVTERLRIDTTGTTTASGTSDGVLQLTTTDSRGAFIRFGQGGSYHNMIGCADGLTSGDKQDLGIRAADNIMFAAGGSGLKWRITSSGELYPEGNYKIGLNSNVAFRMDEVNSNKFVHRYGTSGSATNNQQEAIWYGGGITVMHDNATLSTSNYTWGLTGSRGYALIRIRNNAGSPQAIYAEAGSISSGSDYRMKENIVEITNGIETVKKLKPSIYNIRKTFNPNDDGKKHHGFVAHEVQEAIPDIGNIVSGTKDAMEEVFYDDEDENIPAGKKAGDSTGTFTDKPDYQGIDYGHMTPVLAAAIKELITKVETLESKVSTLEGS